VRFSVVSDPCLLPSFDHADQCGKGDECVGLSRRPGLDLQKTPLHQESRPGVGMEELHRFGEP